MNYSDYCSPGTKIQTSYIKVSSSVQLFEIHFTPKNSTKYPPVIFIPGWGSFIHGWKIVLQEMTKYFEEFIREDIDKIDTINFEQKGELTLGTILFKFSIPRSLKINELNEKNDKAR